MELAAHVLGTHAADVRRLMIVGAVSSQPPSSRRMPLCSPSARRVPLQHLTGRAHFRTLTLHVGPGVFVPRPETEVLVDLALAEVDRLSGTRPSGIRLVDLCAGSGDRLRGQAGAAPRVGALARAVGARRRVGGGQPRAARPRRRGRAGRRHGARLPRLGRDGRHRHGQPALHPGGAGSVPPIPRWTTIPSWRSTAAARTGWRPRGGREDGGPPPSVGRPAAHGACGPQGQSRLRRWAARVSGASRTTRISLVVRVTSARRR